jgi:hypothetical protein
MRARRASAAAHPQPPPLFSINFALFRLMYWALFAALHISDPLGNPSVGRNCTGFASNRFAKTFPFSWVYSSAFGQ